MENTLLETQEGFKLQHIHFQRDHVSQNIHLIFERNMHPMANLCMQMIFVKYC